MVSHNPISSSNNMEQEGLFADIVDDPLKYGIDLFYAIPSITFQFSLSLLVFCGAFTAWFIIVAVTFLVARVALYKTLILCQPLYKRFTEKTEKFQQYFIKYTNTFKREPIHVKPEEFDIKSTECATRSKESPKKPAQFVSKSTELLTMNKISMFKELVNHHLSVPKSYKLKTIFKRGQQLGQSSEQPSGYQSGQRNTFSSSSSSKWNPVIIFESMLRRNDSSNVKDCSFDMANCNINSINNSECEKGCDSSSYCRDERGDCKE